jgi:hypothetical protein
MMLIESAAVSLTMPSITSLALVWMVVVLYPGAMVAEGCSTCWTRSSRPNLSPIAKRSGPAFEPEPSMVWQFPHAIFCGSRNSFFPASASP